METPVLIGAVLVCLVALVALIGAGRSWQQGPAVRGQAAGWLVLALAAALQLGNLVRGYSWQLSVAATAGMVIGLFMTGWGRPSSGPRLD